MKRMQMIVGVLMGLLLSASAAQVKLGVELAQPLLPAGKKQMTYVKVGLTGFAMERDSAPVNVALVLDKSGSMQGSKIAQARDAAIAALERLRDQDIVSVITYDSTVNVVVPATRLSDRAVIYERIRGIKADGSTALFAGVSKGAAELRKFLDKKHVNRIILLSDGQANIGPSSPGELAGLGQSLGREGIAVTTIGLGLGYNEDLMAQLAKASDGNHTFVENGSDLPRIFDLELKDVLEVVAQELVVEINCAPGVRPVRVLGREADIHGRQVIVGINQLYAQQEKYVLLEVEVDAVPTAQSREIVNVTASYANMGTRTTDTLTSQVAARFSTDTELVQKETNSTVMVAAVSLVATERNRQAVTLRDNGKIAEAKELFLGNSLYIKGQNAVLSSSQLTDLEGINDDAAQSVDTSDWGRQRKQLRQDQNYYEQQQRYK